MGTYKYGKENRKTKTDLLCQLEKKLAISTVSSEWKLPYNFNIFNLDGIGWHQYDLPGYPASHSV
jgi:peptide subunit release factor RF-3